MAYANGSISCFHINPAITFGVFLSGRMSCKDSGMYVLFEIIGAIVAPIIGAAIISIVCKDITVENTNILYDNYIVNHK